MLLRMPIYSNLKYLTEAIVQLLNHLKGILLFVRLTKPKWLRDSRLPDWIGYDWVDWWLVDSLARLFGSHEENNAGNQAHGVDADHDALVCFIFEQ